MLNEETMDQSIQLLSSTTFADRRFSRKQLQDIQNTVKQFPKLSHRELALTICEHLNWMTPNGRLRIQNCLNALDQMQAAGLFQLPKKEKQGIKKQKTIAHSEQTSPQESISATLDQFSCIKVEKVTEKEAITLWNEYVDRYHYLGFRKPIGTHMRYFIVGKKADDDTQHLLGCFLFSFATINLACRNKWIGWDKKAEKKRLHLILNNNRFLIFPWVSVTNLASKALSLVVRRIADDWQVHHGFRPLLLETFVDPTYYEATCYKAANWIAVGKTAGHESKNAKALAPKAELVGLDHKSSLAKPMPLRYKEVYLYPLDKNCKPSLITGKDKPKKTKTTNLPPNKSASTLSSTDPFIVLWQRILHIVFEVASDYDQQWQVRSRLINTALLVLFIFRLVFSKNKQGYGITSVELWDQCKMMGIPLSQDKPISAAAFSNARKKLDTSVFKQLNSKIIHAYENSDENYTWKGHRLFAVDGSKINLPRQLLNKPYKKPSDNAYYPQGLVSTLYQVKSQIPYDFYLTAQTNERTLALKHLKTLYENDVVTYDRGYFSYAMLYYHLQAKVEAVFRLPKQSFSEIQDFFDSEAVDQIVSVTPSQSIRYKIGQQHPDIHITPLPIRLVKYRYDSTTYVLGTTLLDQNQYSIKELSELYHARWGVEELYKISKELIEVDDFHGKSEQGVKQELYAHFTLITMSRIFTNHTEQELNPGKQNPKKTQGLQVNMKNALLTMARHIEGLFLKQSEWVTNKINHMIDSMKFCTQSKRPGRKYKRKSMKSINKWCSSKKAACSS